ncbi:MAG: hypothetical protein HYS88_01960 [Candidatus Colwellbacteria bacterium]|nr:hypothetical protein [Candidatus Colwellbacteria bacterium]
MVFPRVKDTFVIFEYPPPPPPLPLTALLESPPVPPPPITSIILALLFQSFGTVQDVVPALRNSTFLNPASASGISNIRFTLENGKTKEKTKINTRILRSFKVLLKLLRP